MRPGEQIEQWFFRYSDDVYQYLVYFTGSRDVEDLVQEVFIKALKNLYNFEQRSQPKTWLISIARNTAIDHMRKQRFYKWVPDIFLKKHISIEISPEEALQLSETKKDLYYAINQLKPKFREIILLRAIKSFSVAETAQILQMSETNVNATFHRAIKALQKKINNQMEGEMNDAAL